MDGLADWLKREAPKANDDFALGAERFRKMLYATERVDTPLAQLESIGRTDLLRNLRALKRACEDYAPQPSVENCVLKMNLDKHEAGPVADARKQLVMQIGRAHVRTPVTNAHIV